MISNLVFCQADSLAHFTKMERNVVILIPPGNDPDNSNVFDYLIQSPGVWVNEKGKIVLKGKSATIFYIDGKFSEHAEEYPIEFLKSFKQSKVEKIEVMFQPPDKFRLTDGVGLINIVSRKKDGNKVKIIPVNSI